MLKGIKTYLVLCLIGLQLFAPFIHAHSFGLDTLSDRAMHFHTNTIDTLTSSNMHADVPLQQQSGYVVTVASGVVPQDASLDLSPSLGLAVFLCFAFLLLAQSSSVIFYSLPPLFFKRHIEAQRSPRAPPRLLNQV